MFSVGFVSVLETSYMAVAGNRHHVSYEVPSILGMLGSYSEYMVEDKVGTR